MNTLENHSVTESAIWHNRMLEGSQEVIHRLTILLFRLKKSNLLDLGEPTRLTVYAESAE